MIQPQIQFSLANAQEYFREHLSAGDYYSQGMEVVGEWLGQGAEQLGLQGTVNEAAFLALCEGMNPATNQKLGQRMNTVRQEVGRDTVANRRIFYDFVIAPPKSVSVVALYQDDRILGLHKEAVRKTMLELEKFAATRVRKSGQNCERVTGNLVTAYFRHDTSRELDPHLHTHCVVFNATFDPVESRWKALHPAGMYYAKEFATNLYRHELCKGLRAFGYEFENTARSFEIKGVPASVIARFSKRNQQINEETNRRWEIPAVSANFLPPERRSFPATHCVLSAIIQEENCCDWPRNSVPGFELCMLFLKCRSNWAVSYSKQFTYEIFSRRDRIRGKQAKWTLLVNSRAIFVAWRRGLNFALGRISPSTLVACLIASSPRSGANGGTGGFLGPPTVPLIFKFVPNH